MRKPTMVGDRVSIMTLGVFGGHVMLLALMKRLRLVSSLLDPATVEAGWPDSHSAIFKWLSREALGRAVTEQKATKQELWTIIKHTVGHLDQYTPRCDEYPEGWRDAYQLVKHGPPKVSPDTPAKPAEVDETDYAEAALEFVVENTKGMDAEAVLKAAGLKRPLCPADESRLLDMVR